MKPSDRFDPDFTYLSKSAREFIAELAITLKPETIRNYKSRLHSFHNWTLSRSVKVRNLKREQVIQWLTEIKALGHGSQTRQSSLIVVRAYLRWLYEKGLLQLPPEYLIRRQDFPKLPDYVPRPLSPTVDRALQEYLLNFKRDFIYNKGLWLMRKTGLRIGELQSLEFDCVRRDHNGNTFLKVPLGKLNTERLVPISTQSSEIVQLFQQRKPTPRAYLISASKSEKVKRSWLYKHIEYVSKQIDMPSRFQSHQLRHTCATELINSGMSLTGVMRFLGHKDFHMTLRYAKITQETIVKEFQRANCLTEEKYKEALPDHSPDLLDGSSLISHLIKWCHQLAQTPLNPQISRIIKQLYNIRDKIHSFEDIP